MHLSLYANLIALSGRMEIWSWWDSYTIISTGRFLKSDDREVVAKFCGEVGDPMMHPKLSKIIGNAFEGTESFSLYLRLYSEPIFFYKCIIL